MDYKNLFEKQFIQEQLNKSSEEQRKELANKRQELAKSEKRIDELAYCFSGFIKIMYWVN